MPPKCGAWRAVWAAMANVVGYSERLHRHDSGDWRACGSYRGNDRGWVAPLPVVSVPAGRYGKPWGCFPNRPFSLPTGPSSADRHRAARRHMSVRQCRGVRRPGCAPWLPWLGCWPWPCGAGVGASWCCWPWCCGLVCACTCKAYRCGAAVQTPHWDLPSGVTTPRVDPCRTQVNLSDACGCASGCVRARRALACAWATGTQGALCALRCVACGRSRHACPSRPGTTAASGGSASLVSSSPSAQKRRSA